MARDGEGERQIEKLDAQPTQRPPGAWWWRAVPKKRKVGDLNGDGQHGVFAWARAEKPSEIVEHGVVLFRISGQRSQKQPSFPPVNLVTSSSSFVERRNMRSPILPATTRAQRENQKRAANCKLHLNVVSRLLCHATGIFPFSCEQLAM